LNGFEYLQLKVMSISRKIPDTFLFLKLRKDAVHGSRGLQA
jgi:hypothetical protein